MISPPVSPGAQCVGSWSPSPRAGSRRCRPPSSSTSCGTWWPGSAGRLSPSAPPTPTRSCCSVRPATACSAPCAQLMVTSTLGRRGQRREPAAWTPGRAWWRTTPWYPSPSPSSGCLRFCCTRRKNARQRWVGYHATVSSSFIIHVCVFSARHCLWQCNKGDSQTWSQGRQCLRWC